METLLNLASGFEAAFAPQRLLFCSIGVAFGTLVGVLPGFGPLAAISLLLPITYGLDPTSALIMLAGIFYGSQYGGSITSILLNIPGEATSAITCLDGYPMSRNGRAGVALLMTALASFMGASLGIVAMILFSPALASFSLLFTSVEYFSVVLVGLVAAATISVSSPLKGLIMVLVGLILGLVRMDGHSGVERFTFGVLELVDGIGLSAVAMGMFGIGEIIASVGTKNVFAADPRAVTLRSMIPTRDDMRRFVFPSLRGSLLGVFTGALPGVGITLSPFMAYSLERRIAKDPSRFGKGAIEGVTAPEAANNAAVQAAFIPTLSLGIPGGPTMAIMLGALMIYNITPGPQFMAENAPLFWALVASFWVGNVLLLILNIPLIGLWVRILAIPYHLLYPGMIAFICIGAYSIANSIFDVYIVIGFGILGYALARYDFPCTPLLLGFILGPMIEDNLRRALVLARGDLSVFVTRPLSAIFLSIAAALVVFSLLSFIRERPDSGEAQGSCPGAEG